MHIKIEIDRTGLRHVEVYADSALEQSEAHAILEDIAFELQAVDTALKARTGITSTEAQPASIGSGD